MKSIRSQLALMSERDPDRREFGAEDHRYRLNGPVDPATLAFAEELIGGRLPEDYREFLLLGNGGAGPYYGVHPLEESLSRIESMYGDLSSLRQDSPLSGTADFRKLCNSPPDWKDHEAKAAADPAYAACYGEHQETYLNEPWCYGKLPIITYGCGGYFFLIVRGPMRGTVWMDWLATAGGLFHMHTAFMPFYKRWLADTLDRLARQDFSTPEPETYGGSDPAALTEAERSM